MLKDEAEANARFYIKVIQNTSDRRSSLGGVFNRGEETGSGTSWAAEIRDTWYTPPRKLYWTKFFTFHTIGHINFIIFCFLYFSLFHDPPYIFFFFTSWSIVFFFFITYSICTHALFKKNCIRKIQPFCTALYHLIISFLYSVNFIMLYTFLLIVVHNFIKNLILQHSFQGSVVTAHLVCILKIS